MLGVLLNVLSTKATGFHRQAKLFELNYFLRETFLYMVKPSTQNFLNWTLL